ncbi:MAG: TraR/DksA family transcriptional regulator [Bdellovibrionota bacterium]
MNIRKEKLEGFKKELLNRREAIVRDLHLSTEQMINDEPFFADSIDQAAADTDRAIGIQLRNRESQTLIQINEALRRIDAGAYGDCVSCGESITEARIKAFPFTTLCIDCKAELESEEQRYPGRA